jgi:hypothetical protein
MRKCPECDDALLPCPLCRTYVHQRSDDEGGPQPNDMMVCDVCAGFLIVTEAMTLELLRREQIDKLRPRTRREMEARRKEVMSTWPNRKH